MGRGDHIRVYRGGYYHHGIDLGNGQVVHFTGRPGDDFNKADATIRKTPLAAFTGNGSPEVVAHPANKALHPDHVCLRAVGSIGGSGYQLFSNNCEHLATYCKTGEKKSTQVRESYDRMWKLSKFGIRHPGLFLAGPAFELLRRGTLYGWHWIKQLDQPDAQQMADDASSQSGEWRALFRSLFGYTGSDSRTYVRNFDRQWFLFDAGREVIPIEEPKEEITYSFRAWMDDNKAQYVETAAGWMIANQGGWLALAPYAMNGGTFQERLSTLVTAPTGALNAMIEVPATFEERLAAINETSARGMGDAITYGLLVSLAATGSKGLAGEVKNNHDQSRGAALWTLAVINRTQHHNIPTANLPGLQAILQVLFDETERDELRMIALSAVQALNRAGDPLVQAILQKALGLQNQALVEAARRLLKG